MPVISVIIVNYNDWQPLQDCLAALRIQVDAPDFEIVVVNDGSDEPVPHALRKWLSPPSLTLVSQAHAGVAAARNHGLRAACGELLVFMDADCVPARDCLAQLWAFANASPTVDYFQLHLKGDQSTLPGRAEELRLEVTQQFLLEPDGGIRFLNTAGFALRRSAISTRQAVFDEAALRGEDTLLLADLLERGITPRFVESAVVRHCVRLSVLGCFVKDFRCAWLESKTQAGIAERRIDVRVNPAQRRQMLRALLDGSRNRSIGYAAGFLLILRQAIRLLVLRTYATFARKPAGAFAADRRP